MNASRRRVKVWKNSYLGINHKDLHLRVDEEMHADLKAWAQANNMSMVEAARVMLEQELSTWCSQAKTEKPPTSTK